MKPRELRARARGGGRGKKRRRKRRGENTEGERGGWKERERESVVRIRFYASTEKFCGVVPESTFTLSFLATSKGRKAQRGRRVAIDFSEMTGRLRRKQKPSLRFVLAARGTRKEKRRGKEEEEGKTPHGGRHARRVHTYVRTRWGRIRTRARVHT